MSRVGDKMGGLKAASCFSGIGAPELGGPQFDWVWHAEIEKFPAAVMAARFPYTTNLGDVTADDFLQRASAFGSLDLLVGGPPCQDFSVAGLRTGVAGDRGNLSLRFMEIAHAIRPRNLLVENVPGWLNMPDNAFGCFLGALVGADAPVLPTECRNWHWKHEPSFLPGEDGEPAECHSVGGRWQWEVCRWPSAGMVAGPRGRAAWRVFDAQYFGVAQRRRRVFVVADFGEGADPAEVLFERKGVSGNTPPRREAGQGIAADAGERAASRSHWDGDYPHPTLNQSAGSSGGVGASNQEIFSQRGAYLVPGGEQAAFGGGNSSGPVDISPSLLAHGGPHGRQDFSSETFIAHSLRGEGFDASEDGTGRGTPIVPVAFSSKDYGNDATDDLSPTLRSMGHDKSHANGGGQMAIAIQGAATRENVASGPDGKGWRDDDCAYTLEARPEVQAVATAWQVRRLTPTECERLQAFPDGFTDIKYRGKPAADGPRYKALGNSWAASNGAWIIARLADILEQKRLAA